MWLGSLVLKTVARLSPALLVFSHNFSAHTAHFSLYTPQTFLQFVELHVKEKRGVGLLLPGQLFLTCQSIAGIARQSFTILILIMFVLKKSLTKLSSGAAHL